MTNQTSTLAPPRAGRPPTPDHSTTPDAASAAPPGRRLWRGPAQDPAWVRPTLLGLLSATALLYLWGLGASGWANSFYSAAVQAGSESWKAFFFGSSDAANSITVDKPPMSLWAMSLSVRIFGLSSWSILVPQALMGVASVGLLHATVRRTTGSAAAGLLAGAVLALTPVAVLMFRFNNPDALLTLLVIGSVACTVRALEATRLRAAGLTGHPVRWLALGGALVGFAFLTKMLQALLVLPALALVYLLAAHTPLGRRLGHLLVAFASMIVAAGWWIAIVELWPGSSRPYIGGSQGNSILELTLGYNGFGRITGNEVGSVGGGGAGGTGQWGETGILRLFSSEIGGQVAWLLPAALTLLVAGLWFTRRRPRTDLARAGLVVWGVLLLVTTLTFSFMAGIFHAYYTVALAPAIAALVGTGAVLLWQRRTSYAAALVMSGTAALTTAFAFVLLDRTPDYLPWLKWLVAVVGLLSALLLAGIRHLPRGIAVAVASAALVAGLAGPAAYAVTTVGTEHSGSLPTAGPSSGDGPGGGGGGGGRPGMPPGMTQGQAPQGRTGRHRDRHPGQAPATAGTGTAGGHRRWHRRAARGQPVVGRDDRDAPGGRELLHVGRGGGRLELGFGLPAGQRGAGHGDRRLQRQRPEPDPGAVPAVRHGRRGPLLHRGWWRPRRPGWLRQWDRLGDLDLGGRQLYRHHGRRRDGLRPLWRCRVSAWASEPHVGGLPMGGAGRRPATALDVVIPVHNEETDLAGSVTRLHETLTRLPYTFTITIADNASTDGTCLVAHRLAHELDEVEVVFLPEKGRGRALKQVWSTSGSQVLAYMDVDLSTDLNALLPLVAPLLSGHSDLAIGSRLTRGSRTTRGPKREVISRGYNLLLRGTLRAQFSDAQCGFKAIRADVAHELLPLVEDTGWFFDTELLVLAERAGLRIHEVPVDWVDDPDSRVDVWRTARDDLRGIARLGWAMLRGTVPLAEVRRRLDRTSAAASAGTAGSVGTQVALFAVVGVFSTLAYAVLYLLLRGVMTPLWANATALVLTAIANTAANRRLTFGVRGRDRALRHQLQGLAIFGVGLGVTSGLLALLHATTTQPDALTEVVLLTLGNLLVTVMRFVAMRLWVFAR